jgi:hypothetical protein
MPRNAICTQNLLLRILLFCTGKYLKDIDYQAPRGIGKTVPGAWPKAPLGFATAGIF